MTIEKMTQEHAEAVARLHIQGIHTGFISSLGHKFVSQLYKAIVRSDNGFGLVAVNEGNVAGFIAFSSDLSRLYRSVLKNGGLNLVLLLASRMFSIARCRRILQNLFYPRRTMKQHLPPAELLAIAVAPEMRGKGIARSLMDAGVKECRERGIFKVKVLVAAANEPANKLYLQSGFEYAGQIESHNITSNIYVVDFAG